MALRVVLVDPDLAKLMDEVSRAEAQRIHGRESRRSACDSRGARHVSRVGHGPVEVPAVVGSAAAPRGAGQGPLPRLECRWTSAILGSIRDGLAVRLLRSRANRSADRVASWCSRREYTKASERKCGTSTAGRYLPIQTGPFGSPISDSTRSMITESAHEILDRDLRASWRRGRLPKLGNDASGERLTQFAGASGVRSEICAA